MARSHLYQPLLTATGDLLAYAQVLFTEAGTGEYSTVPLYRDRDGNTTLPNPATFTPGVLEVWTDRPQRFDLVVRGSQGFAGLIPDIDVSPDPDESVRAVSLQRVTGGTPQPGQILDNGVWVWPPLIGAHDHDGASVGSTVLDPSTPKSPPDDPDVTWVGYDTDTVGGNESATTVLGALAKAAGVSGTALGGGAAATGARSVALGRSASHTGLEGVTLGGSLVGSGAASVWLKALRTTGVPSKVTSNTIEFRQYRSAAAIVELGNAMPTPATPGGVATPLWVLGDGFVPGSVRAGGVCRVGNAASALSFFQGLSTGRRGIPAAGASGALLSLLNALAVYGLITVG